MGWEYIFKIKSQEFIIKINEIFMEKTLVVTTVVTK